MAKRLALFLARGHIPKFGSPSFDSLVTQFYCTQAGL
jgi:hypothetical protein